MRVLFLFLRREQDVCVQQGILTIGLDRCFQCEAPSFGVGLAVRLGENVAVSRASDWFHCANHQHHCINLDAAHMVLPFLQTAQNMDGRNTNTDPRYCRGHSYPLQATHCVHYCMFSWNSPEQGLSDASVICNLRHLEASVK